MTEPRKGENNYAGEKDYSRLSMHLAIIDLHDISEDATILEGIAIPAERAEDFLADVQKLAVEKYGAATFDELLENDLNDDSAAAARLHYASSQIARDLAESNKFTDDGLRAFQKAADRGKLEYEQRMKAEESLRRKEMTSKRKALGLKVIKTNGNQAH